MAPPPRALWGALGLCMPSSRRAGAFLFGGGGGRAGMLRGSGARTRVGPPGTRFREGRRGWTPGVIHSLVPRARIELATTRFSVVCSLAHAKRRYHAGSWAPHRPQFPAIMLTFRQPSLIQSCWHRRQPTLVTEGFALATLLSCPGQAGQHASMPGLTRSGLAAWACQTGEHRRPSPGHMTQGYETPRVNWRRG
ncbi:MAG: hypothetical protein BWY79_02006 [Actinobacteria bacterium ADurb.Bin444]|nr:MAG: hypothetical protein BWY79_02006 [Actinobacteria bacterium ADurb.Bin444]